MEYDQKVSLFFILLNEEMKVGLQADLAADPQPF